MDGVKGYVVISIYPTQPSYEVPNIEVENEEEGCEIVRTWGGYSRGDYADGTHEA